MEYTINALAKLAGVTTRTLRYYDGIGLLLPERISSSGYRIYGAKQVNALQQIMFFRELGFGLRQIKEILDSPGFDRMQALAAQKILLLEKEKRLEAIIGLVEQTLDAVKGGIAMNKKDMFRAFDMSEIEKHQEHYTEETRQKYGHTEAYKESQKKAASYKKEDWAAISARGAEIYQELADLMVLSPADPQVQQAIGAWRQHITDSYYNCTPEIFRGLGDLYVQDERFAASIDKVKPDLARFMSEAMHLYCDNIAKKGR